MGILTIEVETKLYDPFWLEVKIRVTNLIAITYKS